MAALSIGGIGAIGADTAPVTAKLILKDPPPNATYDTTQPIVVVIEVRNASGNPVITTEGFSRTEFWRRLFFTDPDGRIIANVTQTQDEGLHTFFCHSRNGVLQRPTAIPVVPVEVLGPSPTDPPTGFFVSFTIDDVRKYYNISQPGRYTVNARIPLQTFQADMNTLITDCDQLAGETVANVTAVTGRQAFTVVSNSLEFVISSPLRFGGFAKPLVGDDTCKDPEKSPCVTGPLNRAFPVRFQLFGPNNTIITTAQPRIVVTKVGGGTATLKDDEFKFDPSSQQYVYVLHTQSLSRGVWRIDVIIDIDNSVHSAHIGLR
jgi:hypothetical protein